MAADHVGHGLPAAPVRHMGDGEREFANLQSADLTDASLRGAALGGANLTGVTIAGTDFLAADLVSARLVAPIGLEAAKNFDKAQNVQRLLRE